MEPQSYSFRICCINYTPEEHECITDYLEKTGMLPVPQGENVDIILDGFSSDPDQIFLQIHHYRLIYPDAVIIRCIPLKRRDNDPYSISSLFDGYILLDFSSSVWKENLLSLINLALSTRHLLRTSSGAGEKIYQQIFYTNAVPMALSTPESGLFVEVNDAFLHTLGYSREEVIGKNSSELNLFIKYAAGNKVVRKFDFNYPSRDLELDIRVKDGKIINGLFSIDRIYRDGKELFLTTMKDITYLKEVERNLKEKNQFIQDILSSMSEGIIVYDHDLRYLVWNRYMEALTGIPEQEILGKSAKEFKPDIQGDDIKLLLKSALHGVTSASADIKYHVPSTGKEGWVSVIYSPHRDTAGNIIGAIAAVKNISGRKKAEDEVRIQKKLLRSIIDTVPVWITCIDATGKILLANTTLSKAFGITPEKIEGRLFEEFCNDTRLECHISLIKRALAGKEVPFNITPENHLVNKEKIFLRGRYSPLKNLDGTITGVVAVIIDITDLSQVQKALEMINAKLNLLSSITRHDILNSLTGVLGYLSYAEEEKDPDLLMTYVKKAYFLATQIQEQIEFTRDYQDLGVKEPIWQNASTIFTSATKGMKLGNIQIEVSLDTLKVYADPLLERVVYNIIDNALRYGGTISKISSSWYQDGDEGIWVIEDDGVGVTESMKERIFRKGVGHHTGLGLFLTREILDITGIKIRETGTEGKGARFEIIIPVGTWKKTG